MIVQYRESEKEERKTSRVRRREKGGGGEIKHLLYIKKKNLWWLARYNVGNPRANSNHSIFPPNAARSGTGIHLKSRIPQIVIYVLYFLKKLHCYVKKDFFSIKSTPSISLILYKAENFSYTETPPIPSGLVLKLFFRFRLFLLIFPRLE